MIPEGIFIEGTIVWILTAMLMSIETAASVNSTMMEIEHRVLPECPKAACPRSANEMAERKGLSKRIASVHSAISDMEYRVITPKNTIMRIADQPME